MNLRSIIFYLISGFLLYFSLYIAEGNHLNLMIFWDLSVFLSLIAGLFITLVNFKFGEIIVALKNIFSTKLLSLETINEHKSLVRYIWKSILIAFSINFIMSSIIVLSNAQAAKLGSYIAILLLFSLYLIILKLFIFIPLEISLEKKMILKIKETKKTNISV